VYCAAPSTCPIVNVWPLPTIFVISVVSLWSKKHQRNITSSIRKVYYAYFGVKLGDQGKSTRYVMFVQRIWRSGIRGKKKAFRFGVPMVWWELKNNNDDCCFCCCDIKVLCMLRDQQAGYTKHRCFMCELDSRARGQQREKKQWTPRASLEPGSKNVLR
jgi:hypothetical protein